MELPPLDLWEGVLYRLDVYYNHQVKSLVPHFIKALFSLDYSHRKPERYTNQGVQFYSKLSTTKFYDKRKERCYKKDKLGALLAKGILRQETTLYGKKIQIQTGKAKPTLRDITPDLLFEVLENELRKLNLLGNSIGTCETTVKILCEKYGPKAGMYYFGLLKAKLDSPSKEIIVSNSNLHPRSLDRQLNKIVNAGIPLTLTEYLEPLPPLVIDRETDLGKQNLLVSESIG
jgi:hypothetical protein